MNRLGKRSYGGKSQQYQVILIASNKSESISTSQQAAAAFKGTKGSKSRDKRDI